MFRISGIPLEDVAHYLAMDDVALAGAGVRRRVADAPGAYPCRLTLRDAKPGEEMLLFTYWHQPGPSPYAAAGPIFVRRSAVARAIVTDAVPEQQTRRLLSVRAYDATDSIVTSDVLPGTELEARIATFFALADVAYLHVHNARHGCYACRVDRA